MPNENIFNNNIYTLIKKYGLNINPVKIKKAITTFWEKDETQEKVAFLKDYGKLFGEILKKWNEKQIKRNIVTGEKFTLKNDLLALEKHLKLSAMAVIPELRTNKNLLSEMTFGVVVPADAPTVFWGYAKDCITEKSMLDYVKARKQAVHNTYKKVWENSKTSKITEIVYKTQNLEKYTQLQKIDYLLALEMHYEQLDKNTIGEIEDTLYKDAIDKWKEVLGADKNSSVENIVKDIFTQKANQLLTEESVREEVEAAITEYNKIQDPATAEIEEYQKQEELEKAKEVNAKIAERAEKKLHLGVTDDDASVFGNFFETIELQEEAAHISPETKSIDFIFNKISKFNKDYGLTIHGKTFYQNVTEVSKILVEAREEKENYLNKDNVVVIENGQAKVYKAEEYFKDAIDKRKQEREAEIKLLENEKQQFLTEKQKLTETINKQKDVYNNDEQWQDLKDKQEKIIADRQKALDEKLAKQEQVFNEDMASYKGGIVYEKNGDTIRKYKSSEYYETHETAKEKKGYEALEKMYKRVFTDACAKIKTDSYKEAKSVDFAKIAKEADDLFKTAMYTAGVFDSEKNNEILFKGSFGGLGTERLAEIAQNANGGNWELKPNSDEAWKIQSKNATSILIGWKTKSKNMDITENIKNDLDSMVYMYSQGDIGKKQLLDYTIAAESHIHREYNTFLKKFLSFGKHKTQEKAVLKCRKALGIGEKDSLRAHMSKLYQDQKQQMSKDNIVKDLNKLMEKSLDIPKAKKALDTEHQIQKDKELAEVLQKQEALKRAKRKPIIIEELNEKNKILSSNPKSKPVVPQSNKKLQASKD